MQQAARPLAFGMQVKCLLWQQALILLILGLRKKSSVPCTDPLVLHKTEFVMKRNAQLVSIPVGGSVASPSLFSNAIRLHGFNCVEVQMTVVKNTTVALPNGLVIHLQQANDALNWRDVSGATITFSAENEIGARRMKVEGQCAAWIRLRFAPGSDIGATGGVIVGAWLVKFANL
ncbi:MAG: hypothetical protein IPN34_21030 [Planctomycetes bacterium]|nr:hypothetical protein [Planctomycetota bacterium]